MMHRFIYQQVMEWIPSGARVLDLGSGDGSFLESLIKNKNIYGEGVEIDPEMMARCVERGLIMHQGDIMEGLDQYGVDAFDYILLLGTFEELENPRRIMKEAFRVGRKVIIAYRNICFWKIRTKFLLAGRTPVTAAMPEKWYDSPTVHFFSIEDFQHFYRLLELKEERSAYFNSLGSVKLWPNLRAEYGLSLLGEI